ncbi:MAG TPA: MmgE/PrpD family protein [Pseudonocardia sp.]|nr:MmgE/PrpD family protein [Pseudonocardia sp.]
MTARTLARFVTATRFEDLPADVVHRAKLHLLDTLGAGLAGSTAVEAQAVLDVLAAGRSTGGGAAVWGTAVVIAPRDAALANGVAAHAFELDDTGGCDHSGAVVVPAALAALAAGTRQVSGSELVAAVVLGYDVGRRVLEACGGYEAHNGAGWHSTGTCGTFGAAAASARLLGLDVARCAHALGLAASASAGTWAFVHDGSMAKRLHAGRAAEGGLSAALLAAAGVTGPRDVFADGWGGFLTTFAPGSADPAALTVGLGERWRLMRCSIKPYASCRGTHSAIDALRAIRAETGLTEGGIRLVEVTASPFLAGMCGGRDVAELPAAQLSLPYALAAELRFGAVGLAEFDLEHRTDPGVAATMDRISVHPDPALDAAAQPTVTVTDLAGRHYTRRVDDPWGSPTNPLTEAELTDKFRRHAARALSPEAAESLARLVRGLDRLSDARALLPALTRSGS